MGWLMMIQVTGEVRWNGGRGEDKYERYFESQSPWMDLSEKEQDSQVRFESNLLQVIDLYTRGNV